MYLIEIGKKKEYTVGNDGEIIFVEINVESQVDYSLQIFGRWHEIDNHRLVIKPRRINKRYDACKQDLQIYSKANMQTHGHSTQSADNLR